MAVIGRSESSQTDGFYYIKRRLCRKNTEDFTMIKLIAGKKGTGKTKLLINAIHEAEQASNGNVVAIQIGSSLNIDIYHKVRLVNIETTTLITTMQCTALSQVCSHLTMTAQTSLLTVFSRSAAEIWKRSVLVR